MIVYVETNYVLELVLKQENVQSARTILDYSNSGGIKLAYPFFALIEPFWTVGYRGRERKDLLNSLTQQFVQFQRSGLHQNLIPALQPVIEEIREIERKEASSLLEIVSEILYKARSIDINKAIFEQALLYRQQYRLTFQDSLILASIIFDLKSLNNAEPKCFLSQNSKDFSDPGIKDELQTYNCRYIPKLEDGLSFIQSYTNNPGDIS